MKLTYLSINIVDGFLWMECSNANLYTSIGSLAEIGPVYEMPPNLDIYPDIGTHCTLYPAE
jgi:hypothetical protein